MQSTRVSPFSHASLPFIGLWALFFTMPVFAGASGTSIQVTLTPDADTTLYQGVDNSNGGGNHIFAGNSAGLGFRRSLLRFDLSDIPRNATIEDVTLQMRMTRTIAGTLNVRLHRALNDWGEGNVHAPGQEGGGGAAQPGDATWDHRFFPDVLWDTPGGDFAGTQSAARAVMGVDDYTWTGAGMVADVQQWVSQPSSQFRLVDQRL